MSGESVDAVRQSPRIVTDLPYRQPAVDREVT
jgi:hypothetical protein